MSLVSDSGDSYQQAISNLVDVRIMVLAADWLQIVKYSLNTCQSAKFGQRLY